MLRCLATTIACLLVLALSGCSHESDTADTVRPESAAEFARRSLGAIDAAGTCPELMAAWDEYLEPVTRAAVDELVPCTRRVLAATHTVLDVTSYNGHPYFDLPTALVGAQVSGVRLDVTDFGEAESFPIASFLDDGWFVVSDGGEQHLVHPGLSQLAECLRVQPECRMAG